jgi:hypothetical protein
MAARAEFKRFVQLINQIPGYPYVVKESQAVLPANQGKFTSYAVWIDTTGAIDNARDLAQGVFKLSRQDSTHDNLVQAVNQVLEARQQSWKKLSVALDRNHVHSALRLSEAVRGSGPVAYDGARDIVVYSPWLANMQLTPVQQDLQQNLARAAGALGGVLLRDMDPAMKVQKHDIVVVDTSLPAPNEPQPQEGIQMSVDATRVLSVTEMEELLIDLAIRARTQELAPAAWRSGPSGNNNNTAAVSLKDAIQSLIV